VEAPETGGARRRRAAASPEKLENELPATVFIGDWLYAELGTRQT